MSREEVKRNNIDQRPHKVVRKSWKEEDFNRTFTLSSIFSQASVWEECTSHSYLLSAPW